MFFIYPTPQYPRKPLEYVYKTLYLISNVIHIVALVVLITDFYTRLGDSMPNYFTKRELELSPTITMIMSNCTYTGELSLGSVRGQVEVGLGAVVMGLMNMAMYTQALFVLQFLLIFNHVLCSMNYTSGNRHLRIFGVHIPYYHILLVFTFVYSIAITVLTWVYENNRHFLHQTLVHCAGQLRDTNATTLDEAEYADFSIFTTAVYWPFGAVCFGMVVYLSAAVLLFVHSYDKATVLLSQADAPWEGTDIMATTKKPYLRLHTAQRNAIIEDARQAIKDGEKVRIVRSYQLMTEEDFQTLVQAMKDQVARAIKEKQFEKLRENFGDRESQIDDMGFMWRQQMMDPPPEQQEDGQSPGTGTGDQFYDVNFGDYFTDNDYNDANRDGLEQLEGGDGAGAGYDPMVAPHVGSPESLVEYTDDPLFPPDEDYGNTGGDMYDENGNLYEDNNNTYGGEYDDYGDEGNGGAAGWDDEGGHDRRHHRHRRRHSSRSRGGSGRPTGGRSWDDDEDNYGNEYGEPDPRSPAYDDYSPQESGPYDEYSGGGGGAGNRAGGRPSTGRRNEKRRGGGGGRQAEVDDDLVDADALSDDPGFF